MRLIYATASAFPSRAAHTVQQMKMCRAFAANGHDVTMLAPRRAESGAASEDLFRFYDMAPAFEIKQLPWLSARGRLYLFAALTALVARLRRPDLVVGRDLHTCLACALAGLPVIYEAHTVQEGADRHIEWMYRKLFHSRRLARLVTTTEALKREHVRRYDVAPGKVKVIPNGADDWPGMEETPFEKRDGRLQVGYVGHLYPGKGMEVIVPLARRCPWAHFHVVGGTDEEVRRWKHRMSNTENITFHGFVSQQRAAQYRQACDVLLAPYQRSVSTSGGDDPAAWMSPLKLFEYMAAGKPILCSDLPVLHEVLTPGENAWLCSPEQPEKWEAALADLRDHPEKRAHLGRQARRDFEQHYTWTARAKKVLAGLDEC